MPQTQEVRLPAVVNERLLEVPDYQRPYAWGPKQLGDLWEDLDLVGPGGSHYAGTLVLRDVPGPSGALTSEEDDGTVLRHVQVVDGQQRLTTCFLLLDRIRRRLEILADDVEDAGTMASTLRRRYGLATIDGVKVPRLRMAAELNDFWVSVILGDDLYVGPPLIGGQRRLQEAAAFFDAKLTALAECSFGMQVSRLRELQKRITSGLGFLVYEVASASEVGMIFETLNERGRPLTDLEKTKNYLLYLARTIPGTKAEDLAGKINHFWAEIFANLAKESDGMDDQLLRAHWLATQNPNTREWKRIASIKGRFDRSLYVSGKTRLIPVTKGGADQAQAWEQLYEDVSGYAASLRACSYFMAEMFDEHGSFEAFASEATRIHVRLRSAALRRSNVVAIWRPLLLAARLAHPGNGDLYVDLVDLCERYSARVFVIEQRRANAGEGRLLRLAYELHEGKDPAKILEDMRDVLWTYGSDEQVSATMASTSQNWYRRRGHKYLLYEYELSLMSPHEELPPLSWFTEASKEQRTTEHILPQHPNAGATCWWTRFSESDHARLCHSLGNLALTLDNSSYSNKCFADKRGSFLVPGQVPTTCYAQGKLHQEQQLAAYAEWTPDTIEQRQKELATWALEHWAVEPPSIGVTVEDSIEMEDETTEEIFYTE